MDGVLRLSDIARDTVGVSMRLMMIAGSYKQSILNNLAGAWTWRLLEFSRRKRNEL